MGLRGVFISKGGVRGHLTFLGTKDRETAGWFHAPSTETGVFCFFCRGAGLFYLPWREKILLL